MDYEKAYKAALEQAKKELAQSGRDSDSARQILRFFPELAESEDERVRKEMIDFLKSEKAFQTIDLPISERWIAWLEKQKELDKMIVVSPEVWNNAISDAFENGKKEGEKQKEQKPAEWDKLQADFRNINEAFEDGKKEVVANPKKYGLCKPAEWSEEDEKIRHCIGLILTDAPEKRFKDYSLNLKECIDWLLSLRPSWKPSEEQMEAFRSYIKDFQDRAEAAVGGWNNFDVMIRLFEQLKKL